jgi:PAS domain S-box-containing protein
LNKAKPFYHPEDVTAFRETEAKFEALFDGLGEGILFCDSDERVLQVNRRMSELTGYAHDEMIGKSAVELFLPEDQRALYLQKTGTRLKGISETYEIRLRRKDGSEFWAQINATPFRNAAGEICGSLGAVSDATERKRSIDELNYQRELLRWVIDGNPNLI